MDVMSITFHKMHGAGNDFVLLDLRDQTLDLDADRARRLADRHRGIGCDQLLVLRAPADAEALTRFEVWNADGSRAEQCGNGVRCIGLYLHRRNEAGSDPFALEGPADLIRMNCLDDGSVRVDMGAPRFQPDEVPTTLSPANGRYHLELNGIELELGAVSMGNPHAVISVDNTEAAPVAELGPAVSRHPAFPEGCNVGFAQVLDRGRVRLRVFERGADETAACGSGACAAAVVLGQAGLVDDTVEVVQAGGRLIIERQPSSGRVEMTGPAAHVFQGVIEGMIV